MAKKRYSHKQIRKSIKKDELRDLIDKSAVYVRSHTENILIAAILLIVVIVLVPLYFNNRQENERRAGSLLNRAVGYTLQPIADGMGDPNREVFRTLEEKYTKVRQTFTEISATYKNTRAARVAMLGEADATYYLKDYEKARDIYQAVLLQTKDFATQGTLKEKIAACYENLGKWEDALGIYQELVDGEPVYFNQRSVKMGMARCYSGLGRKAKAQEIYFSEKENDPGSYWSEVARQKLSMEAAAGK
ncbi:tetratricopeptide repeat protein [bacterium]|nr:tetratricopeptide repeat protein [bacterium]